ncbi:Na+/H+ antiporter NhaA, partial [Nocardiopsis protaetiae]
MTGANGAPGASRASGPTGGTGATRTTALTGLTRLAEAIERFPQRLRRLRAALPGDDILGALLLLAATLLALLWANLGGTTYDDFWHTHLTVTLGAMELDLSLQHWVNDGLMALFFLMVSLEVKRDFVMGELRQWRRASVPVIAAVAGLVVPALLFLLLNAPGPVAHAWGIVISTDTAFVIGLLAVFGDRVPVQLRAFLVALAVVDDVGA